LVGSIPLPHGGKLINRFVTSDKKTDGMFTISVSSDLRNDIENIADGVFSPLEGFVGEQDFQSIVRTGRLTDGLAWTVPIVLDVDEDTALKMKDAGQIALATGSDICNFAT